MQMIIHDDGRIETPGVNYGGKMTLVGHNVIRKLLAVHVEGSYGWGGIGQPQIYHASQYIVFSYSKREDGKDSSSFTIDDMGSVSFPVRKNPIKLKR